MIEERILNVKQSDCTIWCNHCDQAMPRILSVPSLNIWNAERKFPNIGTGCGDGATGEFGEMSFPTKAAYQAHLDENDIVESKTDGLNHTPHGNKVVMRDGKVGSSPIGGLRGTYDN